jgi:hypothetical protein
MMRRGGVRPASLVGVLTAIVLLLSGCPVGGGARSGDTGGGYHLHGGARWSRQILRVL